MIQLIFGSDHWLVAMRADPGEGETPENTKGLAEIQTLMFASPPARSVSLKGVAAILCH